jgi:hypothetical protein
MNPRLTSLDRFDIIAAMRAIIRTRQYLRNNSRDAAFAATKHAFHMLNNVRKGKNG